MFRLLIILNFLLFIFACNQTKSKPQKTADNTIEKIKESTDYLADRKSPGFDSDSADTEDNRNRFTEFFHFNPTPDIKNLFCYADETGIDHSYLFSFNCDTSTLTRIVHAFNMEKKTAPDNISSGLWQHFPWWDSAAIVKIPPYWKTGEHDIYLYLWYDKTRSKVYYLTYDL